MSGEEGSSRSFQQDWKSIPENSNFKDTPAGPRMYEQRSLFGGQTLLTSIIKAKHHSLCKSQLSFFLLP
jgi:hypothetical protein